MYYSQQRMKLLLLLVLCIQALPAEAGARPPHILLLVADDQGLNDIGYNDATFSTPVLDSLAAEGIKLTHMYAATTCSPTRASLLTGRYINNIGMQDGPFVIGEGRALALDYTLLPEYLRDIGYKTSGFGKWHLGMSTVSELPNSRGFDTFFGTLNGALGYVNMEIGNQCNIANPIEGDMYPILFGSNCYAINGFDVMENGRPAVEYAQSSRGKSESSMHYTELLATKATEMIAQHDPSIPLFVYLAPTAPHSPLEVSGREEHRCSEVPVWPPGYTSNPRSLICQLMAGLDNLTGQVLDALRLKDMLDNTLVVYLSDNGGIKLFGSQNDGLRGQKGSFYEGGVRVPAFISGLGGGLGEAVHRALRARGRPLSRGNEEDKQVSQTSQAHKGNRIRGHVFDHMEIAGLGDAVGVKYTGMVHLTDLFATMAALAGLNESILSSSDGVPLLISASHGKAEGGGVVINDNFYRYVVPLGVAGDAIGSADPGVQRPTSGVIFNVSSTIYKFTDFPNAFAFYGEYERHADLGSFLFDLSADPYETVNLIDSAASEHQRAVSIGMALVDKMASGGVPSPVDAASPSRLNVNLTPNKFGCWVPVDSEYYDSSDCGINSDDVHPYVSALGTFMPTMKEKVYGSGSVSVV